jgi:hypothetical protein
MTEAELIARLYDAFSAAPRPDRDEVTTHRCWECDEVRDRLAPHIVHAVPLHDMEWVSDCLSLLSSKALRYYLPRYFEISIRRRLSNARDSVLFHLTAEDPQEAYWKERYGAFSRPERQAIVDYLRYRCTCEDAELDRDLLARGLEYWTIYM